MRSKASAKLLNDLQHIIGAGNVLSDKASLACYGYDAFLDTSEPSLVVSPQSAAEVAAIVKLLRSAQVPYLARGSGTGYAGGSVPINGEVVILLGGLNRIGEIDREQRSVWVGSGVLTADLQRAVERAGLRYPPDPSSKGISTIGGNVATNAGGPHCLGYGVTSNYVLEVECVNCAGDLVRYGRRTTLSESLDLRGLIVGSEGTLAIITGVRLRLVPAPESIATIYGEFSSDGAAIAALCHMFRDGIQPIALDMTCGVIHPRGEPFPFPNHSMLYVEADGDRHTVDYQSERICSVIREHGGIAMVHSKNDLVEKRFRITQERWRGVTQNTSSLRYFLFDAVVKRTDLATILQLIDAHAREFDFVVANTFHAGDGNIHPTPFFDPREKHSVARLDQFRNAVLSDVSRLGGALSGEHGIGIEKIRHMSQFYPPISQRLMRELTTVFNPGALLCNGKLLGRDTDGVDSEFSWLGDRMISHVENGYVAVPADVTLGELRESLRSTAYEFPYDPADRADDIPLGQLILEGPPSIRERRTGPARDLLLGGVLETVRGARIPFGSVFAKDVSALDIRKLIFGSRGTLGTLREIVLKVLPRESASVIARTSVGDLPEATRLIQQLESLGLPLSGSFVIVEAGRHSVSAILEGAPEAIRVACQQIAAHWAMQISPWTPGMPLFETPPLMPFRWCETGLLSLPPGADPDETLMSFSYPAITGWRADRETDAVPGCVSEIERAVIGVFHAIR